MNDSQFADLADLIRTTVDGAETRLGSRIDQAEFRLGKRIYQLEQKVDNGFAGVGEAIETINQRLD